MRKAEIEYYDYHEEKVKFYCCVVFFPNKDEIRYEYSPVKQELRVKRNSSKNIKEVIIFNIKPEISRILIHVDILLKCIKLKINQENIISKYEKLRDFFYNKFTYIKGIQEKDIKIRDIIKKYFLEDPYACEDPDYNDFGLVVDLIRCGGIKC